MIRVDHILCQMFRVLNSDEQELLSSQIQPDHWLQFIGTNRNSYFSCNTSSNKYSTMLSA